jgi:hypothetical protein
MGIAAFLPSYDGGALLVAAPPSEDSRAILITFLCVFHGATHFPDL